MSGSEDTTTNDTEARDAENIKASEAAIKRDFEREVYERDEREFIANKREGARGVREDAEKLVKMAGLEVCHIRDDHKEPVTRIVAYALRRDREERDEEIRRLKAWVNDLQSGMYINCVYCGHQYGPKEDTPISMADVLKEHVEQCPEHPMSRLKAENEALKRDTLGAKLERLREHYEKNSHFKYNGWEWDKDSACLTLSHSTDTPDAAADKALEEMEKQEGET